MHKYFHTNFISPENPSTVAATGIMRLHSKQVGTACPMLFFEYRREAADRAELGGFFHNHRTTKQWSFA